jgi:dihydroorotate dehydrogenase (fumarate)
MTAELTTRYLGMDLASPLVPSASPLTGDIDTLHALVEAGAAAVVLPSVFEEQIVHDALVVAGITDLGAELSPEFTGGQLPPMEAYNTGTEAYLRGIVRAKHELPVPVIGSLNGASWGGWSSYAAKIEHSGADALELNIYTVSADVTRDGREVEDDYLHLVEQVRRRVSIPLAVKIGPAFSSMASMAVRFADAGADGLVLFNRFYQPDIDLDTLEVKPHLVLSTSAELLLPLTWIGILHGRVELSLAATTGVHTAADVVKLVLAGADVTMMASALLRNGPGHLATVRAGLSDWLYTNGYSSVTQAKGSLSQAAVHDPAAFERANYMKTLVTYERHQG